MSKLVKGWIREPGPLKRGPGTLITMSGLLVLKPCQCSSMQLRAVWQDYGFRRLNYMPVPARGSHSLCSRPPHSLSSPQRHGQNAPHSLPTAAENRGSQKRPYHIIAKRLSSLLLTMLDAQFPSIILLTPFTLASNGCAV